MLRAKSHFAPIRGIGWIRIAEPFARNWMSYFVKRLLYVQGSPKGTPMATQGVPKWSKGCPKGPKRSPKSARGEEKGVQGHPKKPTNLNNYI